MNPIHRTRQAVSFVLAAAITLSVMAGLNSLASPDRVAVSQLVAAVCAPRA
jgi:hypothetical protein